MPRNVYFQNGTDLEQNLFEDIVIEALQIYGIDTMYIPRKIIKKDLILNEDLLSEFNNTYPIEMYLENVDGFEGDGDFLSQFGLEIRDQITLIVSRLRWNQFVGRFGYEKNTARPIAGDLIYLPLTKNLFEIKFVEPDKPFYQIGYVPTFKLICELFEYESQDLDTGIEGVDDIQTKFSKTYSFKIEPDGKFVVGETLSFVLPSGIEGEAEFIRYEIIPDSTQLTTIVGPLTFNDGNVHNLELNTAVVGQGSGSGGTIVDVHDLQDSSDIVFPNTNEAQNVEFSESSQNFIDWSEINPFGEPFKYTP